MTELVVAAQSQERAGPQGHRLGGQAFYLPREGNSARSNLRILKLPTRDFTDASFPSEPRDRSEGKGATKCEGRASIGLRSGMLESIIVVQVREGAMLDARMRCAPRHEETAGGSDARDRRPGQGVESPRVAKDAGRLRRAQPGGVH